MDGASRDKAQRAFIDGDARGGGGHQRLRHGHRPAGRARRRPSRRRPARSRRTTRRSAGRGATGPRPSACCCTAPATWRCAGGCSKAAATTCPMQRWSSTWNLFLELMRWAEGGSCRHDAILRYFGDEAETLAGCGRCDVCRDAERRRRNERGRDDAGRPQGALGSRARPPALRPDGRGQAAARARRIRVWSARASTGRPPSARSRSAADDWLTRLLRRCVTAGFVDFTPGERPVVLLTDAGRAVMKGERPARLVLPRERGPGLLSAPAGSARRRASRASAEALPPEAEARFDALRRLRLEIAREEAVPAFVVASDRTLRDLATAATADARGAAECLRHRRGQGRALRGALPGRPASGLGAPGLRHRPALEHYSRLRLRRSA